MAAIRPHQKYPREFSHVLSEQADNWFDSECTKGQDTFERFSEVLERCSFIHFQLCHGIPSSDSYEIGWWMTHCVITASTLFCFELDLVVVSYCRTMRPGTFSIYTKTIGVVGTARTVHRSICRRTVTTLCFYTSRKR